MLGKIKKYLIVGICWRCGKCFCNKGISLGENNIVTINIVNSLSQPFLFLCANNKPFAFKRLVICIQRINFNSVLKQSFY